MNHLKANHEDWHTQPVSLRVFLIYQDLEATVTASEEKIQELVQWQNSAKKTLKELSKVKDVPDDVSLILIIFYCVDCFYIHVVRRNFYA